MQLFVPQIELLETGQFVSDKTSSPHNSLAYPSPSKDPRPGARARARDTHEPGERAPVPMQQHRALSS